MLNKNKILVGCLSLLLVLSVGYALFSETITINGTATAKGNFDISVSCITNVTPDLLYELGFEDSENGTVTELLKNRGYKNETCDVNEDIVTYSVGLEYPTALKISFVKMTNEGSIPAYFDFENVSSQSYNNTIKKYDEQNNLIETKIEMDSPFFVLWLVNMVGKTSQGQYHNLTSDQEEFIRNFADVNEETGEIKFILEPGETMYFPLAAEWPQNYGENNVTYEATGTFKIDWIQYTE